MIWMFMIIWPLLLAAPLCQTRLPAMVRGGILAIAPLPAALAGLGLAPVPDAFFPGLFLGASFGLDGLRTPLLAMTALLWSLAGLYAGEYTKKNRRSRSFDFYFLLTMAGNLGLIVARDAPSFYTFFVLMTFASYGLVVHDRSREAFRAGRVYLAMAIVGELFLIASLFAAVHLADSVLLQDLGAAIARSDHSDLIWFCAFVGFGVKAGAIPLYFWLPLAHPVAPTPASAVLSGTMIKAGLLGWVYLFPLGSDAVPLWSAALVCLGLAAAIGGVVVGLVQRHPKTILAYSSISQMGMLTVLLGLGLAAPARWPLIGTTVALYFWNHGVAKATLFLGTGVAAASQSRSRWVLAGLIIPALAIAGAPLTAGSWAKASLKGHASLADGFSYTLLAWGLPFASLATTVLLLRFLLRTWETMGSGGHGSPERLATPWTAGILLSSFGVFLAVPLSGLEWPGLPLDLSYWLGALWPIGLGLCLFFGYRALPCPWKPTGSLPPGDFLVILEAALRSVRIRWNKAGWPNPAQFQIDLVSVYDRLWDALNRRRFIQESEARIEHWNMAGLLFIVLTLIFLLSL